MIWTYLTKSYSNNILTFEQIDSTDVNSHIKGYCELINDNFFDSFSHDYDTLIISNYKPNEDPFNNDLLFCIKFNDKIGALLEIKKMMEHLEK